MAWLSEAWPGEARRGQARQGVARRGRDSPSSEMKTDDTYERYIGSIEWAAKRGEILARDGNRCQTCWRIAPEVELEVHHKTYQSLGDEDPAHLITLCRECHEAVTAVIRRARYAKREIPVEDVIRRTPTASMKSIRTQAEIPLSDVQRHTPVGSSASPSELPQVELTDVKRYTPTGRS